MIVKIHVKIGDSIKEFYFVNPQNLVFHEADVGGGSNLAGADGQTLSKKKMIIHPPQGPPLAVEETKEELLELFNDGKDSTICTSTSE